MTTTTSVEQLLTTEGLANLLGRSADWWARKARKKEIPHVRVGQSIRFTTKHVEQIVESFEVPVESSAKPAAPAAKQADTPMGLTPRSAASARRRAGKAVA